MKVLVAIPESGTRVYLEGLNGYRNEKCEPKIADNLAVFELSLINFYECGIIRVVNKLTVSGGDRSIHCGSFHYNATPLIDFSPQIFFLDFNCAISHFYSLFVGQENILS